MKKKILAMAFAVCLVFGTAAALPNNFFTDSTSISASAEDDLKYGDYYYTVLDDGTVMITGFEGTGRTVNIPETINKKRVTVIGARAFDSCSKIATLTIPKTVKTIKSGAFQYCTSLTSVTIPSTVTTIEDRAYFSSDGVGVFEGCTSLTKAVVNGGSIAENMFKDCTALTSVTIGSKATVIGNDAFNNCISLSSINIPVGVEKIGTSAFEGCKSLATATIGNGVTAIQAKAFASCKSLSKVTIGSKVGYIGAGAFEYCISLPSITIPQNVTEIADSAYFNSDGNGVFEGCTSLKSAVINCGKIGNDMFSGCTSLTTATLGSKVGSVGEGAFEGCKSLTSIKIPDKASFIGESAFKDCTMLKTATIGNGVDSIGNDAFRNCSSMTSVTIGNNVSSLGSGSFAYCTSLTSVTIPTSVATVGSDGWYDIGAFTGCTSLKKATVNGTIIGNYMFKDCSSLTRVSIRYGVIEIGNYAFRNCKSLAGVIIPGTVKTIGEEAFCGCSNLANAYILDGVTEIGTNAFASCTDLGYVYISNKTVTIKAWAFYNIKASSIVCPKSVVTIEEGAFGYYNNDGDDTRRDDFRLYCYSTPVFAKEYAENNDFKYTIVDKCSHSNYKTLKIAPTRANKGYTLHMCTRCGHTYKDNYTVLDLTIKTQPKNVTVSKAGATATFTVSASGTGLKYEWYVKDPKGSWTKTGATTNKYSVSVTAARNGRQVFCKVIDASKKYVKSNTVTAKIANTLKITTQPKNVTVSKAGNTATFSVTASGTGLKYEWYIKDVGGNWTKVGSTSNKYSVAIKQERNGRQVFCKVIDKSGKFVKSNIVNAHIAGTVVIISQPSNVTVSGTGKTASFSVKAAGTNMKYEWYIKDRNGSWTKAGSTTNKYSVSITKARNGRQVFCKVIDKSGKYAKSRIVTAKIK